MEMPWWVPRFLRRPNGLVSRMSPMRCLMVVRIISFQKKLREDGIDEEKVMLPVLSLVDSFAVDVNPIR